MAVWIDKKYLNLLSAQLPLFKWKGESIANHRCVICGDSKKNKFKARGYHYVEKGGMRYKCHNCQASMSTGNFIKYVDPGLHKQYVLERFKNGENGNANYQKPIKEYQSDTAAQFENKRRIIDSILDRVDTLPDNHIAVQYVNSRKIPEEKWSRIYFIDDIHKMENLSDNTRNKFPSHEPRLILPFFDRKGQITGFTARAFDNNKQQKKYLTGKVREDGPLIYQLDEVDFDKPIIVVEGPIDSLFLDNAVAVGGTNLKMIERFLPKDKCILVFDNQPRNKELIKIIQQTINTGYKISFLPSDFPGKDINDAILNGLSSDQISSMIIRNASSGLEAQAKFTLWKKV